MIRKRSLLLPTLEFEKILWKENFTRIAGIDEAGRGAWAGPVCAAAVILPVRSSIARTLKGVRDSKLMSPPEREAWAPSIREAALAWGIGFASAREIDDLGIVPATKLAAVRALSSLSPDYLLTDALLFREIELTQTSLIKGDQRSLSISAASVLAKTARDEHMRHLELVYPGYSLARHKGYGTRLHRQALLALGTCLEHRRSFSLPILV
jgi:ribonuclease HII